MNGKGFSFLLIAIFVNGAAAQELPKDPGADFWGDTRRQQAAAAAQMIGIQDPFAIAAMRIEGSRWLVWPELPFTEEDLALDPIWLEHIRDDVGPPDFRKRELVTQY